MEKGGKKRKIKFGNQERLFRLIPKRETKMEIDADSKTNRGRMDEAKNH